MRRFLDAPFGLRRERTLWIEQADLGKEKLIRHRGRRFLVKIPEIVNKEATLRLAGLGSARNGRTGDLLLHLRLDQGDDIHRIIWLSESSAGTGIEKALRLPDRRIQVVVPPGSYDGLAIRLKGLGTRPAFNWRAPMLHRRRGNLLVKLRVFPDTIVPEYGSFDTLATDDMALEGWAFAKVDEVIHKLGASALPAKPKAADEIADLYNVDGARGVFHALVRHLRLTHCTIGFTESATISRPGNCMKTAVARGSAPIAYAYSITINAGFLDNPFAVAAIIAHELCHVVYSERIDELPRSFGYRFKTERQSLEEEHTVDLLMFVYKIGEFQLRAARDRRLTLGYFNQPVFERMQVFVSRKLHAC